MNFEEQQRRRNDRLESEFASLEKSGSGLNRAEKSVARYFFTIGFNLSAQIQREEESKV